MRNGWLYDSGQALALQKQAETGLALVPLAVLAGFFFFFFFHVLMGFPYWQSNLSLDTRCLSVPRIAGSAATRSLRQGGEL